MPVLEPHLERVPSSDDAQVVHERPDIRELIRREPLGRADLADVPARHVDEGQPAEAGLEVHTWETDLLGHVDLAILRVPRCVEPGEADAPFVDDARVEDVIPVHDGAGTVVELDTGEEAAAVGEVPEQRRQIDRLVGLAVAREDHVFVAEPVVDPDIPLVDVIRVVVDRAIVVRLVAGAFVRERDQVDQLLPERIEAVLRDLIVRKLGPVCLPVAVCARIIDGRDFAEVTELH